MKQDTIQGIQLLLNKGLEPKVICTLMNVSPATVSNVKNGYYDWDGSLNRPAGKNAPTCITDTPTESLEEFRAKRDAERKNEKIKEAAFIPQVQSVGKDTVLIIGDLHAPYTKEGYLEFCLTQYKRYNCNRVVFIGDLVDFASMSYHEKDGNVPNPEKDYRDTIAMLKNRYAVFPEATVILGNHDLLPVRKMKTIGLPESMIKGWNDLFCAPKEWVFTKEIIIDDVLYRHGDVGNAYKRCITEGMSLVQGHLHTEAGIQFVKNRRGDIFGMQVGTGIDRDNPAFAYAAALPKQQFISCGVVIHGVQPILIPGTF